MELAADAARKFHSSSYALLSMVDLDSRGFDEIQWAVVPLPKGADNGGKKADKDMQLQLKDCLDDIWVGEWRGRAGWAGTEGRKPSAVRCARGRTEPPPATLPSSCRLQPPRPRQPPHLPSPLAPSDRQPDPTLFWRCGPWSGPAAPLMSRKPGANRQWLEPGKLLLLHSFWPTYIPTSRQPGAELLGTDQEDMECECASDGGGR